MIFCPICTKYHASDIMECPFCSLFVENKRYSDFSGAVPSATPAAPVDPVNSPPHYRTEAGLEAIDVIEAFGLGFELANAVKYLLRAGRKGVDKEEEDLAKAIWYVNRRVRNLKKGKS